MSDLPYRYPISISHISIGSYLVTVVGWCRAPRIYSQRVYAFENQSLRALI